VSETLTDPLLGRVVDGRYEIREHVATGGMATVYLAFDKRLEREVALKAMHQPLADDDASREFVARFRREAKSSARLTHPGIVHVYDQGVDGELSYITMEYVRGQNLRERIAQEGTLTVGEALGFTDAILDALAAAHRLGLVHRDIKPENVLIDTDGRARITDFGLARAVTEAGANPDTIIMGSPGYLAPEVLARGETAATMDVYAAGVMLFEMVTGRHPFTGESAIDIASKHVHEDIPVPSSFAPWLPTEFDDLVGALCARDPDERPADAAAALVIVRSTRARMDDPTLDRRADPPSGSLAILRDRDATTVLETPAAGTTVALPVGIGRPFQAVGMAEGALLDADPEALEPQSNPRRGWWWLGAILAVIILLGGVGLWWYNAIGPGAYTTIPPVVDKTQEDATSVLKTAGFVVHVETRNDDEVLEGNAIGTDPGAQQRAQKGTDVTLLISLGPVMTEVPSVVGRQESEANARLKEAKFPVGEPKLTYSDTVPKGEVMSSDPQAGETVRHDTTITLEVSNGPEPIKVPSVTDMTLDEAQATLAPFALKVTVEHERTEKAPEGIVFKQDPKAKADAHRTDAITITVSDGPPLVTVPDFTAYDDKDQAVAAAKSIGLDPKLTNLPFPFLGNGVTAQSISAGKEVPKGSSITLYY
jgi:serine/threonine-protein kinase